MADSKKKRRKAVRGAVPGSSKFATIYARASFSASSRAPSIEVCSAVPLSDAPSLAPAPSVAPLSVDSKPDLCSGVTSGLVSDTDLPLSSPLSSTIIVEGPPSDETTTTVEGPSSGEATDPTAVDNGSAKVSSPLPRKWSAVARDSFTLEEVGTPTQHISGAPFVLIPDTNIEGAKKEFKDFVFAQFHGPAPEMGRVIGIVNAIWAKAGPRIFVHRIGPGAFLLKVQSQKTRDMILNRNLWYIAGHPMFVAPWSPEFNPEAPPISSAAVTVEFRGVPYLLFNNESLSRIATAVGKHVALAPETARK